MPKTESIACDAPGCVESVKLSKHAGELLGWLCRTVTDQSEKLLVDGVRTFHARTTLYLCPAHAASAETLPSPPTHPEVLEFLAQEEPLDGTGTSATAPPVPK